MLMYALAFSGCPTQLNVSDVEKNNLLPIGPESQNTSQNLSDSGVVLPSLDAGHASQHNNIPNEPDAQSDGGEGESAAAPVNNDAGNPSAHAGLTDASIIDATPDMDAGAALELIADAGQTDTGAWETPVYEEGPITPSSYTYERLAIGGLGTLEAVAIHPDGTYAIILERTEVAHVLNLATMQATPFELGNYTWNDVRFHPNGTTALLVGYQGAGSETEGIIFKFNDHAWRTGIQTTENLFTEVSDVPSALKIVSLKFPTNPESSAIILFTGGSSSNRIAYLRSYNVELDLFEYLGATSTGATEMTDLAFVNNEFGNMGILIVGGHMGAAFHYYTEVGGVSEWRAQPGNSNTGNISYVEAHPSGNYAIPINWSSGKIYRFESGTMCTSSEALSYNLSNIRSIAFQPNGQRALIFGRTSGSLGSIYEYRHDRFECSFQNCDVSYAPINNFSSTPYNADSNTYLMDGAWRSDCVGGLLVSNDPGMIITFQAEGAVACWD